MYILIIMLYRDYRFIDDKHNYVISNYGQVFSLVGKQPRELKMHDNGKGYFKVHLGGSRFDFIHAYVGEAFIGKRKDGYTYDHIDRDRKNNRADNIRLATASEQMINQNIRSNNKTGVKNIYSWKGSWIFEICRNGDKYRESFKKENYTFKEVEILRDMRIADYQDNINMDL